MKINILIFFFIINVSLLNAQEVVSSFGMTASNANGSMDATIGEVIIDTHSDGNNQITQGFHQSNLSVLAVDDFDKSFKVSIYPNPSSNIFHLDIPDPTDIHYKIFSINGQLLVEDNLEFRSNQIKIDQVKKGIYFLGIYRNNQKIKTYKIIKE